MHQRVDAAMQVQTGAADLLLAGGAELVELVDVPVVASGDVVSRERAHVTARRLIGAGFAPGERILITADTWPGFFDSFTVSTSIPLMSTTRIFSADAVTSNAR